MNKSVFLTLISTIDIPNVSEIPLEQISQVFEDKFSQACKVLNCSYQDISNSLKNVTKHYFSDSSLPEWKYLLAYIHILSQIGCIVDDSNEQVLSVRDISQIKFSLKSLASFGIYTKLYPTLPFAARQTYTKTSDIFYQYNILKCTVVALCKMLKNVQLRVIILTECFKAILVGLYQIGYCPIKKDLQITNPDIYNRLLKEKEMGIVMLQQLKQNIHPNIYVRDSMMLVTDKAPLWFKKAVSQTLTNIMLSPLGVEHVTVAMLSGSGQDNTRSWKALDVLYRLILTCKPLPDFKDNICKQVLKLLDKTDEESLVFENLFIICTKKFYFDSVDIGKDIFLRKIMTTVLYFTQKIGMLEEGSCSDLVKKNIRLLHALFVEKTVDCSCLPIEIIKPVLAVIFRIYIVTLDTTFKTTNNEAKALLLTYMKKHLNEKTIFFDSFLFSIKVPQQILGFSPGIALSIKSNDIIVEYSEHTVILSVSENADGLLKLLQNVTVLLKTFFVYLLNCLNNRCKYLKQLDETLCFGENEMMNEYFERSITIIRLLSILSEDKSIQKAVSDSPEEIVYFIAKTLQSAKEKQIHAETQYDSEEFQQLFTIIMILNSLVKDNTKEASKKFEPLIEPLHLIKQETNNVELATMIGEILENIDPSKPKSTRVNIEDTKSNLDLVLEDICDPLLPVRGHGLMSLKKLVEKKDSSVMQRKQYVVTIFQQNLKNEDSFIYLTAIDGLAAMAEIFPDTVLNVLCEEYSDFTKKQADSDEVRIKLGEVLVRVTRALGEMASKYKALLLNTVLNGTKDYDHLVRASALSNLGELCKVLGFRLGTVLTEVLVCVHSVITTDKAIEARRAAVTVIRQLLAGLESETIAFLKEDILPIYRTLKEIYHNDRDDVMRLQAQLALEELNENMRNLVFSIQLNMEKKIVIMN